MADTVAITAEPVRGRTPPPWFRSLPGIERVRAFSRGLVPRTPLARLFGFRTTHLAAGRATLAMPVGELFLGGDGQFEPTAFSVCALEVATATALEAGADAVPLLCSTEPLRPTWPRGSLIARARVLDSGNLFVLAEVQVEDSDGRALGRATLRSAVRRVEPAPPPPPESIAPVEEPVYATPDPYLRPSSFRPGPAPSFASGLELVRSQRFMGPVVRSLGLDFETMEPGRVDASLVASEWFCDSGAEVSAGVLCTLGNQCSWAAALTMVTEPPTTLPVPLGGSIEYYRPGRPDGRTLRIEGTAAREAPDRIRSVAKIFDADGHVAAVHSQFFVLVGTERRAKRESARSRRVLATLLFTDIVDSTTQADRLGDAAWQELLDRYRTAVRQEVSRHNGTEVDSAGDGVFARFDSPAQAIQAARAVQAATGRLGVALRAGIHTGECELVGTRLAGIAVHVAARIQATAAPGEILVSSTVKELTSGSHFDFTDRGAHELKGVPDPWHLFALVEGSHERQAGEPFLPDRVAK